MYTIVEPYHRFDQKNNMVFRPLWDPSLRHINPLNMETQLRNIERGIVGFELKDFALAASASVVATSLGTDINKANVGLTSWESLPVSMWFNFPERKPVLSDEAVMTDQIKRVARYFGADLVGIAKLDMRWVYSHHYIPETGESKPVEIDHRYQYVIVMALEMDYDLFMTAPSAVHTAETRLVYSKMAFLVSSVAQLIRQFGYRAIPALNDTALSVPIAVDAGLGELSRQGLLITPEFGPRQRLCKVITDLPLLPDDPVELGVTQFCSVCGECVRKCPAHAIFSGEPTAAVTSISSNSGVMKWPLNAEKCREYWSKVGTNCGICIRVCPFNKGTGGIHNVSRWFIKHISYFDSWLVWMNRVLGYGKRLDSELFWKGKI